MTMWVPDLSALSGPRYRAIAAAIAADVEGGRLRPGTRLPTHRALAERLNVTVGTVTRGYAEAERNGLVSARVGCGTFVEAPLPAEADGSSPTLGAQAFDAMYAPIHAIGDDGERLDLSLNYPHSAPLAPALAAGLSGLMGPTNAGMLAAIGRYQPPAGMAAHREAAALWLGHGGIVADPDDILIVPGCQGGLLAIFMALASPGETVLTEVLTWPGLRAATAPLGLKTQAVEMDADGLRPDAFEAACRRSRPRLLYTMANLHNPTCAVMPEARRREIAAIARAHDVFVVEDDVYGFLLDDPPPPIRAFLPDLGIYVTSLSKSVAPGLRIGYLWAPPALRARLTGAIRANVLMTSPVTAEIARQLIVGGGAEMAAAAQRTQARHRQQITGRILEGLPFSSHPSAFHLWLRLPTGWRAQDFVARLLDRGVAVTPGHAFAGDSGVTAADAHVRLCLCAIGNDARFEHAVRVVAEVARGSAAPALPVV